MIIVMTDNYNRDCVADCLIATAVYPKEFGELLVKLLNSRASNEQYFKLLPDTYKLSRGMEDLV